MGAITITDERDSVHNVDATTTVIHDEATRRVVLACLWDAIADRMGGGLETVAWTVSDEAVRGRSDTAEEFQSSLRASHDLLVVIDDVRATPIGESVDLPLSGQEWSDGIRGVRHEIEESEGDDNFFAQSVEVRIALLATLDAAARLRSELGLADAVA